MTIGEAVALGLCVAEWSFGDEFVRAHERTEEEEVANVLRVRDETARLSVTQAGFGGAAISCAGGRPVWPRLQF